MGVVIVSYEDNLKHDYLFDGIKTFEEIDDVDEHIYLCKVCVGDVDGEPAILTIREVLERIGYDHFYNSLIERMRRRMHDGQVAVIESDIKVKDMVPSDEQKLLSFLIADAETGNNVINGGILFANGVMSYHT